MEEAVNGLGRTPADKKSSDTGSKRGSRRLRSESPSGASSTKAKSARKMATPRKPRKGRGALTAVDENATTEAATGDDADVPMTNGTAPETVKVEVETTTAPEINGHAEELVETTKVSVEVPANHPDLELPDNMEDMLQKAREMVAEAEKISSTGGAELTAAGKGKGKRKADEITAAEEIEAIADALPAAKRARGVETELRKERVRRRALTGIAGVLALGYVISSPAQAEFPGEILTWLSQCARSEHHGRVPVVVSGAFHFLMFGFLCLLQKFLTPPLPPGEIAAGYRGLRSCDFINRKSRSPESSEMIFRSILGFGCLFNTEQGDGRTASQAGRDRKRTNEKRRIAVWTSERPQQQRDHNEDHRSEQQRKWTSRMRRKMRWMPKHHRHDSTNP